MKYEVTVKDISNISSPLIVDVFLIEADGKDEAMDKAHSRAEKEFPYLKRLVVLRKI